MRIRRRLSGAFPKQVPSYKYCYSTGWLRPTPPEQQQQPPPQQPEPPEDVPVNGPPTGLYSSRLDKNRTRNGLQHCVGHGSVECGCQGAEAIGDGDEPRTPPPCYGEKPAVVKNKKVRLRHKQHHRSPDSVKGESSSSRKRVRVRDHLDTAEAANERSSQDKCGPLQRPECNNDETADKSVSYQLEISRMDPLLRAMHTVVSEAGIEGLTARETAQRMVSRGLCSEADVPRSVKMAKTMRDSPYLVEIARSSKFVLWSTFLEESSRNLPSQTGTTTTTTTTTTRTTSTVLSAVAGVTSHPPYKRRRRQRLVNSSFTAHNNTRNSAEAGARPTSYPVHQFTPSAGESYHLIRGGTGFPAESHHLLKGRAAENHLTEGRAGSSAEDHLHQHQHVNGRAADIRLGTSPSPSSSPSPAAAAAAAAAAEFKIEVAHHTVLDKPRKFLLDLNSAPDDDW